MTNFGHKRSLAKYSEGFRKALSASHQPIDIIVATENILLRYVYEYHCSSTYFSHPFTTTENEDTFLYR